jgi:hypothetical protein
VHLTLLDYIFWVSGYVGYIILMSVLIIRKRYQTFRWFTILLGQDMIQSIVLYLIHKYGSDHTYFYTYWAMEWIDAVLRLFVLWEIARETARYTKDDARQVHKSLLRTGVILLPIAAILMWRSLPAQHDLVENLAIKSGVFTGVLVGVLVIMQVIGAWCCGVRLRVHTMALSIGLCFYYAAKLVVYLIVMTDDGGLWLSLERWLKPIYILCLFFWSIVLWFDQPQRVLTAYMDRFLYPEKYSSPLIQKPSKEVEQEKPIAYPDPKAARLRRGEVDLHIRALRVQIAGQR